MINEIFTCPIRKYHIDNQQDQIEWAESEYDRQKFTLPSPFKTVLPWLIPSTTLPALLSITSQESTSISFKLIDTKQYDLSKQNMKINLYISMNRQYHHSVSVIY